jgi:hypothetical protein
MKWAPSLYDNHAAAKIQSEIIMRNKLAISIALAVISITAFLAWERSGNSIVVDGNKYKFVLYEVDEAQMKFSREDPDPGILKEYPWFAAATLNHSSAFMRKYSEAQLRNLFESPPENPKASVEKILSSQEPKGDISLLSIEQYSINGEENLYIVIKMSDFPNGKLSRRLIKYQGRWVLPDGRRDPDGNTIKLLAKISDEVHKANSNGVFKVVPVSRLAWQ